MARNTRACKLNFMIYNIHIALCFIEFSETNYAQKYKSVLETICIEILTFDEFKCSGVW